MKVIQDNICLLKDFVNYTHYIVLNNNIFFSGSLYGSIIDLSHGVVPSLEQVNIKGLVVAC